MTGSSRSSDGLDLRRRRLLFRSWHRGIREMDLIMGRFADAHIEQLTETDLNEFEQMLELPDQQLLAWMIGTNPVASAHDTTMFRRVRDYHLSAKG